MDEISRTYSLAHTHMNIHSLTHFHTQAIHGATNLVASINNGPEFEWNATDPLKLVITSTLVWLSSSSSSTNH